LFGTLRANLSDQRFLAVALKTSPDVGNLPDPKQIVRELQDLHVQVSQDAEVRNFLLSHREIASALIDVVKRIRGELGEDTELVLGVDESPVPPDEYLILNLRRPEYDQRVLDVMRDETLRVLQQARHDPKFLVTSDFVASAYEVCPSTGRDFSRWRRN
jgi:hypothetical protein